MFLKKLLKNRYFHFGLVVVIMFSVLGLRLAQLTVEMGEAYYNQAQERKMIKLTLRGARGSILDRNGIPLAVNKQIYVAQLDRQWMPQGNEEINELILRTIEILEGNGERLIDNIPIKYGTRVFDSNISPTVISGFYYDFNTMDPEKHKEYYNRWRKDAGIKKDLPADEMMEYLRDNYRINEEIPDELARKIISIRLDLYLNRFRQYEPVRIAENIGVKTVTQLSTYADELPGVQVVVEAGRYYPNGESAQHIIGYVGRMTDKNIDAHMARYGVSPTEDGYNIYADKYGQDGVEAYAERWLTGNISERHGELEAEVDASRRVIKVLREKTPQNGDNIILTIDSRLQRASENILAEELAKMREGAEPYSGKKQAPLAESGAIVVMDIHTGEILTMASYADSEFSYDLNDFARGISAAEYSNLINDPSNPLFGIAFQGRLAPGSVFKMLVGMGALTEGKVTLQETILDKLKYKSGPACWSTYSHGNINLIDALKVSCNYYFTVIGERLGIDGIRKWGEILGLHGHPGLEILPFDPDDPDKNANIVAHPSIMENVNSDSEKARRIRITLQDKYGLKISEEDSLKLVRIERSDGTLAGGLREVEQLTNLLLGMGYFDDEDTLNAAISDIRDAIRDVTVWYDTYTLQASIGQSITKTSPLGIARYLSTLLNGGKVLDTHIIKEVRSQEGEIVEQTVPVYRQVVLNEEYTNAIKEGLRRVIYATGGPGGSGTALSYFKDMDAGITLGGKTGTAQTWGSEEHNTAWFAAFTPYEEPEVAVVVMIPNGRTSGNAAPIARRVIEEYYRIMNQDQQNDLPAFNSLSR